MINKRFLYILLTWILGPGLASDPWGQQWLELDNEDIFTFNYTKTEGLSHLKVSMLSLCWFGQEPSQCLSLTSLGRMLKLEP